MQENSIPTFSLSLLGTVSGLSYVGRAVREEVAADLGDDDFLPFAGEVHQPRRVFLRLDVVKARVSAALQQPTLLTTPAHL